MQILIGMSIPLSMRVLAGIIRRMQERLNRQERKSQTRERLIDAAAVVFARRGFEAASLDEVAAAAGYTKGAVYSNFASKTDLFIALIERRIEVQSAEHARRFEGQDLEAMARGLDGQADQETGFGEAVGRARRRVLAARDARRAGETPDGRAIRARQDSLAAGLIASIYEKAGQQPPLAPRDMAIVIEALGVGLAFQAALDPAHVRMSLAGRGPGQAAPAANARIFRLRPPRPPPPNPPRRRARDA